MVRGKEVDLTLRRESQGEIRAQSGIVTGAYNGLLQSDGSPAVEPGILLAEPRREADVERYQRIGRALWRARDAMPGRTGREQRGEAGVARRRAGIRCSNYLPISPSRSRAHWRRSDANSRARQADNLCYQMISTIRNEKTLYTQISSRVLLRRNTVTSRPACDRGDVGYAPLRHVGQARSGLARFDQEFGPPELSKIARTSVAHRVFTVWRGRYGGLCGLCGSHSAMLLCAASITAACASPNAGRSAAAN